MARTERSVEVSDPPPNALLYHLFMFGAGGAKKDRRGLEPERVYVYYIVYYKLNGLRTTKGDDGTHVSPGGLLIGQSNR